MQCFSHCSGPYTYFTMIRTALVYFFQIHYPQPIKYVFVALALLNSALMLWLAFRRRNSWFGIYMGFMAPVTIIQGSPLWGVLGEVWLILTTTLWVSSLMPRDSHGKLFGASIALLLAGILTALVPAPWPNFPPGLYFTRLYSTLAFLGIAVASYLWTWQRSSLIPALWFVAVMFAGVQRGIDYWTAGIAAKLAWTACLVMWLNLRSDAATDPRRAEAGSS